MAMESPNKIFTTEKSVKYASLYMFNKMIAAIPAKIPELTPRRSDFFMFFLLKVHNLDIKSQITVNNIEINFQYSNSWC